MARPPPRASRRPAGWQRIWPRARSQRRSGNGSAPAGTATSCGAREGAGSVHKDAGGGNESGTGVLAADRLVVMADPQEVLAERVSAAVTAAFGADQAG